MFPVRSLRTNSSATTFFGYLGQFTVIPTLRQRNSKAEAVFVQKRSRCSLSIFAAKTGSLSKRHLAVISYHMKRPLYRMVGGQRLICRETGHVPRPTFPRA